MKLTTALTALLIAFFGATSSFAQTAAPPPPPPAPDYFPESWKEFTFENDNVKIRYPKQPTLTTSTDESAGLTVRDYVHASFIRLVLSVNEYHTSRNLEEVLPTKELFLKLREGMLANIARFNPQIIKEYDTSVSGYPAKFIHVEANNGDVVRTKFFVVKNRFYIVITSVKKGSQHGSNYENDFEKVAMAFLDSVRLISPRQ
jgi:hypothetical protein